MIAAVYLRVSTDAQTERNQEPDCLRLCAARGWEPRVYREKMSGVKKRPEWERVLEDTRVGRIYAVVVWSVDRLGRTRVEVMKDLWSLTTQSKAAVVSCRERIVDIPRADATTSPLMVIVREQAIGWLTFAAEDERIKLIERTKAGLARARAEGKQIGRSRSIPEAVRARIMELHTACPDWTPGQVSRALKAEGLGEFHRVSVRSIWVRAA